MKEEIYNLKNEALALLEEIKNLSELNSLRLLFLGRKGKINQLFKKFLRCKKEEKIKYAKLLNETKEILLVLFQKKEKEIKESFSANKNLLANFFDPTLPGVKPPLGHLHLVTEAIEEISAIFEKIGFIRVSYPEVDWDWYVFEALNMPPNHPARDEWETLFVDTPSHPKWGNMVLTTHTSNGQVREMERVKKPPIKMINISKCYRRQQDVTHTLMFHQFEGLVVDKNVSIPELKGIFDFFAKEFFGPQRKTRFRPFHFCFTEPSFEVDINCPLCLGKGCRTCKSGWHELGGAGMVHPNVLKAGKIDPDKYRGFAFGLGVERTFMMKTGLKIPDLRIFYSNDLNFLYQF